VTKLDPRRRTGVMWQIIGPLYLLLSWSMCSDRLAERAEIMFHHAYNGYMNKAFPLDELDPITCLGIGQDHRLIALSRLNQALLPNPIEHEIRGGFSLTLIDALGTLAVLGDVGRFHDAVDKVIAFVHSFEIDSEISVFESNIRVLGGLLSAHQFCIGSFGPKFLKPDYDDELLELAYDLGRRLLPAFDTTTGIPVARVNLKTGKKTASTSNCPAAGGTLILEFGILSVLTGDMRFYEVAEKALMEIWIARTDLNLLGSEIDVETGNWIEAGSMIGAGADSIFEYMLKGYIMFGDPVMIMMYKTSRDAIKKHLLDQMGHYHVVNAFTGSYFSSRSDALGAFYPGLLVLAGEIDAARAAFDSYYLTALKYGGGLLPEAVNWYTRETMNSEFNLRPELIESAYYLYQATRDPLYLRVGETIMHLIEERCKTPCGYADLANANDPNSKLHRTESFLLSETLKYLYLLFKEDHWLNKMHGAVVFTTEAHLLIIPQGFRRQVSSSALNCPAKPSKSDESLRFLQFWNSAIGAANIDSYNRFIWHQNLLNPPTMSSVGAMKTVETIILPPRSFVYLREDRLYNSKATFTLSSWPCLQRPGYVTTKIVEDARGHNELIVIVSRRRRTKHELKRSFLKTDNGKWLNFSLRPDVSPRVMVQSVKCGYAMIPHFQGNILDLGAYNITEPLKIRTMSGFTQEEGISGLLNSLLESPQQLVWAGLPVHNVIMGNLVDYAFDHLMKIGIFR